MKILDFILNNKDYLEDFVTRSTYNSNAIEGSTLTYGETYAILYNNDVNDIYTRISDYHMQFEKIQPFEDGNRKNW